MHVLKAGVEMNYGWRVGVVIALIVVMAVALASLLLRDSGAATADTTPAPTTTSLPPTTTSTPTSTTTAATTTTRTTINPEARIAEVELILEDLYVRWFDAIYRKDESALPDIVALQRSYDAAVDAMPAAEFLAAPAEAGVDLTVKEILLDQSHCLVVEFEMDLSELLGPDRAQNGVRILWPRGEGGTWRLARLWSGPGDLWEVDCDLTDRTEIP